MYVLQGGYYYTQNRGQANDYTIVQLMRRQNTYKSRTTIALYPH